MNASGSNTHDHANVSSQLLLAPRLSRPPWPTQRQPRFAGETPAATGGRKRREPPPAVIPTAEVEAAGKLYRSQNYPGAVAQAKAALNRNERYTPAMLVMAKAYFKLGKNEWVKTLGDMMKNANARRPSRRTSTRCSPSWRSTSTTHPAPSRC